MPGKCTASGVDDKGPWDCDRDTTVAKGLCVGHYQHVFRQGRPAARLKFRRGVYGGTVGRASRGEDRTCMECYEFKSDSEFARRWTVCKPCDSLRKVRSDFGLSLDEVAHLFSLHDGLCHLCRKPPTVNRLHIDHDHICCGSTKDTKGCGYCVRGALCQHCNVRLVSGYEILPSELRTWTWLNEYLERRPIRDMRMAVQV